MFVAYAMVLVTYMHAVARMFLKVIAIAMVIPLMNAVIAAVTVSLMAHAIAMAPCLKRVMTAMVFVLMMQTVMVFAMNLKRKVVQIWMLPITIHQPRKMMIHACTRPYSMWICRAWNFPSALCTSPVHFVAGVVQMVGTT